MLEAPPCRCCGLREKDTDQISELSLFNQSLEFSSAEVDNAKRPVEVLQDQVAPSNEQ